VPLHRVAESQAGIVVRGARILATLAPFADEIAVYPAHPLPAGAEAYALAFSIPVDTPGLLFLCRDSAAAPGAPVDRPLSTRFNEQDAFVIFDDVEIPRERLFINGRIDLYNSVGTTGLRDNMTNQTTIRALTKLEFAYGLATRMAEAIGDASPATQEMLGELLGYVEVARSAVLLSAEHGRDVGDGVWFPDGRLLAPMRSLLATCAPSRRQLDDAMLRPLIDEFLHGAKGVDAEERAASFRLAGDIVGSSLAGRNVLYERFYLTSAARNRINHHLRNLDRRRAYALVDGILAAGRTAGGGPPSIARQPSPMRATCRRGRLTSARLSRARRRAAAARTRRRRCSACPAAR
jgi:4-hydroxyphenylacetate 3-monooxygenase